MSHRSQISQQFGRNLAEARGWAGLSQEQLAKQAAMRQCDISRFERGLRCPRLDTAARLAEVLELLLRDLLYGIE